MMRSLSSLLIIGAVALSSSSSSSLLSVSAQSCGWSGYDFSSLANADMQYVGSTYTDYLRVCGILSQPACYSAQNNPVISACYVPTGPGQSVSSLGSWAPPPTWSYIDSSNQGLGVQYSMTGNGPSCFNMGGAVPYTSNVIFNCLSSGSQPLAVSIPTSSCVASFNIYTSLACAGGNTPSPGLSGGWIFIILLLVLFPVYLVAGCVYKNVRQGATGMEMIPNIAFWRDLPGLIKDGCVFTYTKIRGLCGGGGGGGGGGGQHGTQHTSTYESM